MASHVVRGLLDISNIHYILNLNSVSLKMDSLQSPAAVFVPNSQRVSFEDLDIIISHLIEYSMVVHNKCTIREKATYCGKEEHLRES